MVMAPEVDKRVWSKIQNVVVSANIFATLPLEKLAVVLDNSDYTPETFPGLIYKVEDENLSFKKASFLLFSSGRVICAGTKSIKDSKAAVQHVVEDLKDVGIEITKKPQITVQNMVASGSVGGKLNLNEIVFLFENTEYEPEQFPGLVYKLKGEDVLQNITFLLFGTGKIVIAGAKSEKEIKESVVFLREQLIDVGELEG
ncbi:TATA-box-binding protein [Candidatus Woesearchaeota archaeon]|jgi:transcription initiation factor TFIID TATA-box-binding protein|nr:TATA-box-binding protein [Candidatus Woesearchaeota archaeon]|tara:strand:- start:1267 stop:1866 length:600 start_codon:yes stop_codon:yes gene_type:complete